MHHPFEVGAFGPDLCGRCLSLRSSDVHVPPLPDGFARAIADAEAELTAEVRRQTGRLDLEVVYDQTPLGLWAPRVGPEPERDDLLRWEPAADWIYLDGGTLDIGMITMQTRRQRWARRLFPWVRRRQDRERAAMMTGFTATFDGELVDRHPAGG